MQNTDSLISLAVEKNVHVRLISHCKEFQSCDMIWESSSSHKAKLGSFFLITGPIRWFYFPFPYYLRLHPLIILNNFPFEFNGSHYILEFTLFPWLSDCGLTWYWGISLKFLIYYETHKGIWREVGWTRRSVDRGNEGMIWRVIADKWSETDGIHSRKKSLRTMKA